VHFKLVVPDDRDEFLEVVYYAICADELSFCFEFFFLVWYFRVLKEHKSYSRRRELCGTAA